MSFKSEDGWEYTRTPPPEEGDVRINILTGDKVSFDTFQSGVWVNLWEKPHGDSCPIVRIES